jgi:uncharacterized protein YdaU (DUF1376 family)
LIRQNKREIEGNENREPTTNGCHTRIGPFAFPPCAVGSGFCAFRGYDKVSKKNHGHWMPLYIGDYLSNTMHLNTEQHGAYLLLIMAYWDKGGALPHDDMKLSAICKLTEKAWSKNKSIIAEFFDLESNSKLWVHHRIEKEIADGNKRRESATEKGKTGAAARWGKKMPQA